MEGGHLIRQHSASERERVDPPEVGPVAENRERGPVPEGWSLHDLPCAVTLSRLLEAYLWGVTGTDAVTLGVAAAGILGVSILACWVPAREAAGVDPITALSTQ